MTHDVQKTYSLSRRLLAQYTIPLTITVAIAVLNFQLWPVALRRVKDLNPI
jgi:hypothetical protein